MNDEEKKAREIVKKWTFINLTPGEIEVFEAHITKAIEDAKKAGLEKAVSLLPDMIQEMIEGSLDFKDGYNSCLVDIEKAIEKDIDLIIREPKKLVSRISQWSDQVDFNVVAEKAKVVFKELVDEIDKDPNSVKPFDTMANVLKRRIDKL